MNCAKDGIVARLKDKNYILAYELIVLLLSYELATAIRFHSQITKLIRTAYFEFLFFEIVLFTAFSIFRPLYYRFIKRRRLFIIAYTALELALVSGLSYAVLYTYRHFPDYSRLMVITVFLCSTVLITALRLVVFQTNQGDSGDPHTFLKGFVNAGYLMDHGLGNWYSSPDVCLQTIAAAVCACFVWKGMLAPFGYFKQYAGDVKNQWPYYSVITILAVFALIILIWAIVGNWFFAGFLTIAVLLVYTVITIYSIQFHGTVLTTEDFHNIQTAGNVLSSYRLELSEEILHVLKCGGICFVILCAAALICSKGFRGIPHYATGRIVRGAFASALFFLLYLGSPSAVVRELDIWDWNNLYCKHGLLTGTVESTIANAGDIVDMPDGYTDDAVSGIAMSLSGKETSAEQRYPDIIMILNETWYDPGIYRNDLMPDADYMTHFKELAAVKGHAVVPYVGGGTNASEYEMLTANSVQLIKAYAPFNRINFNGQHSIVDYLKRLGYATMAAHPHNSSNYHRTIAWKQMGFDEMHFIDEFRDVRFYANRTNDWRITDISAFENFTRMYENMPDEMPRFGYLLTMQNHGGWTANSDEQNMIHIAGEGFSDEQRNMINEFLSCMKCTDDMIPVITDYFTDLYEKTGRKVVVYMTGDHAPSFIREISDHTRSNEEEDIILRSTPYFIWTNYDTAIVDNTDLATEIDLTALSPMAFQVAELPLSPYMQYILDISEEVSAFTNVKLKDPSGENTWSFLDRFNEFHLINEGTPIADRIRDYFYLEYNNNGSKAKREEKWFLAETGE